MNDIYLSSSGLSPNAGNQAKGRNVIAVASGKGGVGKTFFSISLTQALARAGNKTLLFDGDLGLANVDIQLGLMPKHDLGSVIAGRLTLNQATTRYDSGGFDVIAGRSGSGSLANIPNNRLQMLADDLILLAGAYDKVVLDLGAGVETAVRMMARQAGTTLVVTSDEPTSLTDAYAFIKVTVMERPKADIRVVINNVTHVRDGERTYATLLKACQGFLKVSPPLAGIIRRDDKVRDTIRHQTPILTRHPSSDVAKDIEAIARGLLQAERG